MRLEFRLELTLNFQPQNIYCISIDEKASKEFKDSMLLLTDCFPNIFVMVGISYNIGLTFS